MPTSREKTTVATATSMPCQSGGWLGMDAIAAKAKMWNNEPAGRSRHQATISEQPPATRVVATTWSQMVSAAVSAKATPARAVRAASSITATISAPART